MTTETAAQLRAMRKAAGYRSARSAAVALRVPVATYIQHENGQRAPSIQQFETYRVFFYGARLVRHFQRDGLNLPDLEVIAALVYDGLHQARQWNDATPQTAEVYRRELERVFKAHGVMPPANTEQPAQGAPGGS